MRKRFKAIVIIACFGLALVSPPRPAVAGFTSITSSGAGGTGSAMISTPSIAYYTANMTSLAPIDFLVNVDSPGTYFLSFNTPGGNVTNSTGIAINAITMRLLSGPSGSALVSGQNSPDFPLPNLSFPGQDTVRLSGLPLLGLGGKTAIGAGFSIAGGPGPQTFTVELTPFATVPEPTSVVLLGLGLLGTIGSTLAGRRRGRHRFEPTPGRRAVAPG